jgi:hypothetical protein
MNLIRASRLKQEELIPDSERPPPFQHVRLLAVSPIEMEQTCLLPFWREPLASLLIVLSAELILALLYFFVLNG